VLQLFRQLIMAVVESQRGDKSQPHEGPGRYHAYFGPYWEDDDLEADISWMSDPSPADSVRNVGDMQLDGCIQTSETLPEKSQQLGAKMLVSSGCMERVMPAACRPLSACMLPPLSACLDVR